MLRTWWGYPSEERRFNLELNNLVAAVAVVERGNGGGGGFEVWKSWGLSLFFIFSGISDLSLFKIVPGSFD